MFNPLMSDGNNPLNSTDKPCLSGVSGSIETGTEILFQPPGKSLSTGVSQPPIDISPLAGGNSDNFILSASHVLPESALVEQALESGKDILTGLGKDPDFTNKMNIAFGNSWDAKVASNLVKDWLTGDFSELPKIEIRAGVEINEANGAFAAANNTIYLSRDFLAKNAGNTEAVTSVVLEEIGHSIDSKVNVSDAAGDEGDIFARLVQGKTISADELLGLKAEDDRATITIGGKDISIEMSQIAMTSIGDKVYQSHRGLDNKIYTRFSKGFTSDGEGVIWSDWKATTSGTTYSAPSLETFKGKLYQSTRGTDDKIYTRSSTGFTSDGEAVTWTDWVPAPEENTKTKNAIALEVFQDKLYQSHRGFDNKIYNRSTSDGVTWSGWTATTSGTTYSAPSLEAVGNNKLYQSSRGTDDKIYTRFTSNGSTWSEWKESGGTTYSTPDIEEFKGKLYQSTRGTDDKIYSRFSADGINWNQWKESGGETPTAPTLEAVGDKLFQSVQGLNQKIYTRFSSSVASNSEITWSPWKESGGYSPLDRDDFSVIPTGEFNAEYYNNKDLSGAPTVIYKESKIDKNWGTGGPGKSIANDNFSVRWTGKFNFDQSNYAFKVKADDGVKLWVDNKLVINQWKDQSPTEYSANVDLTKGTHEVKVEYYEKEKGAQVKAWWEKAGYYSQLSPLKEDDWDRETGDDIRFDGNPSNGESRTEIKQIYADISTAILGSQRKMNAGYLYDQSYYNALGKWHSGIDFKAKAGDTVKAAAQGKIVWTDDTGASSNGYFIAVEDKNGKQWVYGHLQSLGNWKIGNTVKVGDQISTVGSQLGSNAHFHLAVGTKNGSVSASPNQNLVRQATMSPLEAYWLWKNS
ncbi:PA14 domain-containing protein [Argonema galeatum]|uniref:PA14 domain-containing protein n=1 Tax=Argonema galeatum TaxID=2942762 RepID=UPI0020137564|nr:PA14 domain-containing protein [Argonema galeatum]MCL1464614.1 peptidoglycan DD-metalloendopeptidase family protein [Argonema galeatum A003/A1]